MSKQMMFGVAAAVMVAALVVFGMVTYAEHVRQDADTKAKMAIEQAKVEAAEQRIQQISKDVAAKDTELEKLKDIKTPQQAQKVIREYLPLPTAEVLPDAPSASGEPQHSTLTFDDAKKMSDFALSCRQCENEREGANSTLVLRDAQLASMTKERDDAVTGAKGGSLFKRLKNNSKWMGAGVGVGAALVIALTHRPH